MKFVRNLATHTAIFFVGYWIAGGFESNTKKYEKIKKEIVSEVSRNYEERVNSLEREIESLAEDFRGKYGTR